MVVLALVVVLSDAQRDVESEAEVGRHAQSEGDGDQHGSAEAYCTHLSLEQHRMVMLGQLAEAMNENVRWSNGSPKC